LRDPLEHVRVRENAFADHPRVALQEKIDQIGVFNSGL
jgi:hypothetical protein